MRFCRLVVFAVLVWGILPLPRAASAAPEPVRIGVLAFRPKPQTLAQWQPLAKVLKHAIPTRDFIVEAYTFPELKDAVAGKQVDFVLTNPGHYVLMAHRSGLSAPIATLVNDDGGYPLSMFGGVIFSRAEVAGIEQISDLRGKTVAATSTESLGGYQMEAYELALAGLRLPQDARLIETGMPHDRVVEAVLGGQADAGFVRTGVLEGMAREGRLDMSRIRVLNSQHLNDFPWSLSTRLYPEWSFAVMPHIDEDLARHVAAALFLIEEDAAAIRALGIHGFTIPADYRPVENLLRELRMPPFEAAPRFTARDVWDRYNLPIAITLLAGLLVSLLGVRLLVANRHLKAERLKVQEQTRQLQESETRFRTVADYTHDWEYWQGPQYEIFYMSPSCKYITGYAREEFIADPGLLERIILPEDRHLMDAHLHDAGVLPATESVDFRITRRDGEIRWIAHVCQAVYRPDGQYNGRRVSNRDITDRKVALECIRHMAQHDALTNLPNRALLSDRLGQALALAKRDKQHLALMFIDLDRFKPINDSIGHAVGDLLLAEAARRMQRSVRESDTVARIGGDEFVVLLAMVETEHDALAVAEKIRQSLNQPFELAGHVLSISASIGIAIYPEHGGNESELVRHADEAMYRSKESGGNNAQLYRHEMTGAA